MRRGVRGERRGGEGVMRVQTAGVRGGGEERVSEESESGERK